MRSLHPLYPHAGGDYHFLQRAYGRPVSFLFGWARLSVITTGSIALLGFVFGDYVNRIWPLDFFDTDSGPFIYAISIILILSWLNLRNIRDRYGDPIPVYRTPDPLSFHDYRDCRLSSSVRNEYFPVLSGSRLSPRFLMFPTSVWQWSSFCSPSAAGMKQPISVPNLKNGHRDMVKVFLVFSIAIITSLDSSR